MTTITPASVRIGRDSKNSFYIDIFDEKSRSARAKVRLTAEQFAMALTGLSIEDAECEWLSIENAGMKREMKQVRIPFDHVGRYGDDRPGLVRHWMERKFLLVDGWQIANDGCRSRQDGSAHIAHLARFVEDGK